MNTKRMFTLFKRELTDILRDKKTLFMMLVVPIIIYPLLIIGMTFLMSSVMNSQAEKTYLVAFDEEDELTAKIADIIENNPDKLSYKLEIVQKSDCKKALEAGDIDIYVSKASDGRISLCYLSAKDRSNTALDALTDAFEIYREELQKERIDEAGLDADYLLNPIHYEGEDLSSTEESVGNMIGSIIPFFIVTMILLGALYPSIDVTAGEKERGTLETLLTLPITNFEMIMSKFLAVSCIACASAILNVFSMGGAMAFLVSSSMSLAEDINLEIHYETFIPGILFTLVVMVFFALLVTAVCMCTCVFAKNFKEANNYVTPVMLIFMFGSYAAMIPDLELTAQTAAIPIVNVALLVEGLFQFQYNYGLFAIVLFSNVAYSLLAILILGKIYNSEAVLFSEGLSSVRIFTRRSEMKEKQMPGYGDLILLLCLVLLLIFYVGSFAQIKWGFGGVVIQQLIILLCPVLYAWYMKADAKKLFSIKKPGVSRVAGGILFGIAAFLCAMIVGVLLVPFFSESADGLTQLDDMLTSQSAVVLILVVALMPAIGEELLFRGFVMGTLKNKCTGVIAVLVTTLLFAAYHMSLIKMFTIGIIGFGLTYAAYKSGSIVTSMCMHFLNNLLSVLITKYPKQMQHVLPVLFKESLSASDLLLMIAVILICAALGLLLLGCRKKKQTA